MYLNNNKDKVLEATFLLSIQYGFDNVSIKQIQEEANISAGAIYYHFKDKNDILNHMLNKYVRGAIRDFKKSLRKYEGSFVEKLKFIFYLHLGKELDGEKHVIKLSNDIEIDHTEFDLFLLGIYHQHHDLRSLFDDMTVELLSVFREFVEEFQEKKEIRDDFDSEEIALYIYSIIGGFIKLWAGFTHIPMEKYIDINIKMICESVCIKN
ncbi:MAG: TetR/AcrR family transcriptional regulator [Methanobrevibacter sp.]|nr:TetR/AcrR family transcriptional regulator [Methanobrevibacter sp.]